MDPSVAIELGRNALFTALLVSSPVLILGLAVGLAVGIFQAVTQIQDHTIAFVPKLILIVVAVTFSLPWLLQRLLEYWEGTIRDIPHVIGLG